MPVLCNQKTYEERDLWIKACAAKQGENVEGLSKSQKQRIRKRFYVLDGNLIDKSVRDEKGIERPAFVDCDFQRLWKKHHDDKNHPGRDVTVANIETEIAQISQTMVKNALLDCHICRHKSTVKKAPVGKPISAKGIWQRVGIDLIDMSSRPDGHFKWIYHAKDHVSKYSYAVPLKSKTCAEVAEATKLMFLLLGAPKILQHDRGGEFCGKVMQDMIARDFPDTKVKISSHTLNNVILL
jgi:hypothetical protein